MNRRKPFENVTIIPSLHSAKSNSFTDRQVAPESALNQISTLLFHRWASAISTRR
jgi:hypothetical protein